MTTLHEKQFIGWLLDRPDLMQKLHPILTGADFQDVRCGRIWDEMRQTWDDIGEYTSGYIASRLNKQIHDNLFVKECLDATIENADLAYPGLEFELAKQIKEKTAHQKLKFDLMALADKADNHNGPVNEFIIQAQEEISKRCLTDHDKKTDIQSCLKELKEDHILTKKKLIDVDIVGLKTFVPHYLLGHFVFFNAYTSAGKTAFSCQHALDLAKRDAKIVYFTTELPKFQIAARMMACVGNFYYKELITGEINNHPDRMNSFDEWQEYMVGHRDHIHIYEGLKEIDLICNEIKRLAIANKCTVAIIDHLGLCTVTGLSKEYDIATYCSHKCQNTAKDYNVIVLGTNQISNEDAKNPDMNFIGGKGSGWWGADAHVVIRLHRPNRTSPMAKLVVQKNSMLGPIGSEAIFYNHNWNKFISQEEFIQEGGLIVSEKDYEAHHKRYV